MKSVFFRAIMIISRLKQKGDIWVFFLFCVYIEKLQKHLVYKLCRLMRNVGFKEVYFLNAL